MSRSHEIAKIVRIPLQRDHFLIDPETQGCGVTALELLQCCGTRSAGSSFDLRTERRSRRHLAHCVSPTARVLHKARGSPHDGQ